jgi:hypothetical protein
MAEIINFEEANLKKKISNFEKMVNQLNDCLDSAPAECEDCGSTSFAIYCNRFECLHCECCYTF